jgi:hypothetical protein
MVRQRSESMARPKGALSKGCRLQMDLLMLGFGTDVSTQVALSIADEPAKYDPWPAVVNGEDFGPA